MSETAAPSHIAAINAGARGLLSRSLGWLWRIAALLAGVSAIALTWHIALVSLPPGAAWLLIQVPLGICSAGLAWRFAAGHERRWVRPARALERLIREARSGQTPIESLSQVTGPVNPLARQVQELMHDLRREQQARARMTEEISQLVRNRTGSLESKLAVSQNQAYRDVLTGLNNRRRLDECLPKLLEQGQAAGSSLCVLAIDLDNFKKVNDSLGHAVGDRLLREVGQIIRSSLRENDLAFRLGGDEFLILLPNNDLRAGLNLARRLAALVDQMAVTVHSEPKPGLSVGTICLTDLAKLKPADVLEKSDAAMYQEKAARKKKKPKPSDAA